MNRAGIMADFFVVVKTVCGVQVRRGLFLFVQSCLLSCMAWVVLPYYPMPYSSMGANLIG